MDSMHHTKYIQQSDFANPPIRRVRLKEIEIAMSCFTIALQCESFSSALQWESSAGVALPGNGRARGGDGEAGCPTKIFLRFVPRAPISFILVQNTSFR